MRKTGQEYKLRSLGLLGTVRTEVEKAVRSAYPNTISSNEILELIPTPLQSRLASIATGYRRGPFKTPASYVGAVASRLTQTNTAFYHDYHHWCPTLERYDDGFKLV